MSVTDFTTSEKADLALANITGKQSRRLTVFLVENNVGLTHEIARELAIGNISCAARAANAELEKQGLRIIARLPRPRVIDRFGSISQVHEWHLVSLRD